MSTVETRAPGARELKQWPVLPCPTGPLGRDVALDLLRGLAMAILVVNHAQIPSWLTVATSSVLSAAEILVPVSGVAVGMVFGRRWQLHGAWTVTAQLWARARKLYLASVVVVALVGVLTMVPGLAIDAVTVSRSGQDLYAFDGLARTLLAVVTLEAGPWQFNILGFFVVTLLLAPGVLWLLARGWAVPVLVGSAVLWAVGRALDADVLPTQSEGPFPLLVWQGLFVPGMVVGYHRRAIARGLRGVRRRVVVGAVAVLAMGAVLLQVGLAPADVLRWQEARFDKAALDPLRAGVMVVLGLATYLLLRRWTRPVERAAGWLLLPLGRNSFFVFIVHVPLCVVLASAPGLGMAANSVVLLGAVVLLSVLARWDALRWIPR